MTTKTETETQAEIENNTVICTYLLTIRRVNFNTEEAGDFRNYFIKLAASGCEVLVVDGSPPEVFAEHAKAWRNVCRHEPVDPQYKYLNGKVNGIHTGVAIAAHDRIILADDDIRYTPDDARRMADLLEDYDMVRPQNYFPPACRSGRAPKPRECSSTAPGLPKAIIRERSA
jgi:cellulose synthase/poly-beta-1,6-N-acetylglucosamine synthase-like glycosyltransferase